MVKLALIGGAGNIGGSLAYLAALSGIIKEIVVFDLKGDICSGKALDIAQCSVLAASDARLKGSDDYNDISDADIIVITAGLARQPGMSRDDLLLKNASIITDIAKNIKAHAKKDPMVIVVTNPLDVMAWVVHKVTGYSKRKVIGMSGLLDTSRFNYFLAEELGVSSRCISSIILGSHGDTMVPLLDYTAVAGIPLKKFIDMGFITHERISEIMQRAKDGGAEIVKLLGSGSAYYAPATCVFDMIKSYVNDSKMLCTCCTLLEGEYGVNGLYVGVPVIIGNDGVEKVIELPIVDGDLESFARSVDAVKALVGKLSI